MDDARDLSGAAMAARSVAPVAWEGANTREVRAMNVYPVTDVDRDLLLSGADLEAVLADRERERLEPNERTEARVSVVYIARPGERVPGPPKRRIIEPTDSS